MCSMRSTATIKEGQIDGGASLNASPGSLTFVAGVHLKEPAKIEDALKKMEAVAKNEAGLPGNQMECGQSCGRELPHAVGAGAGR